jgi:hypothetical protein
VHQETPRKRKDVLKTSFGCLKTLKQDVLTHPKSKLREK